MILHRNLVFNVCPKDEGWHVNLLGYSFDGDNSTWIYKVEKRGTKCIISSKTAKSHYHHHGAELSGRNLLPDRLLLRLDDSLYYLRLLDQECTQNADVVNS